MSKGYYWVECGNCRFIALYDGLGWNLQSFKDEPYILKMAEKHPIKVVSLVKEL